MSHANDLEKRLMNLEIKASFTEDLVEQLNHTVYQQQHQIDTLLQELGQLRRQAREGGTGGFSGARDELPPHY